MIFTPDSSIWISAFIITQKDHFSAHLFYERVMRGQYKVIIPFSVSAEVLCAMGRRLQQQTHTYRHSALVYWKSLMTSPNVLCKSIDERFTHDAAWLGWSYGLKGMDAFVATTALYYNVPLITSDSDFNCVKDVVTVLSLRDVLEIVP